MQAEFELDSAPIEKFLAKLHKNFNDIKGAERRYVDSISAVVFGDIVQHFEQQEGSEGPWTAWSDIYTEHMVKIGRSGNNILQDTGRLRQAFIPTNYRKAKDGIEWFNAAKTETGFPYAYAHNAGGHVLPKRDFMWLSQSGMDRIALITVNFLKAETDNG